MTSCEKTEFTAHMKEEMNTVALAAALVKTITMSFILEMKDFQVRFLDEATGHVPWGWYGYAGLLMISSLKKKAPVFFYY